MSAPVPIYIICGHKNFSKNSEIRGIKMGDIKAKGGKKNRKHMRMKVWCKKYRDENRRMKSRARRMARYCRWWLKRHKMEVNLKNVLDTAKRFKFNLANDIVYNAMKGGLT